MTPFGNYKQGVEAPPSLKFDEDSGDEKMTEALNDDDRQLPIKNSAMAALPPLEGPHPLKRPHYAAIAEFHRLKRQERQLGYRTKL